MVSMPVMILIGVVILLCVQYLKISKKERIDKKVFEEWDKAQCEFYDYIENSDYSNIFYKVPNSFTDEASEEHMINNDPIYRALLHRKRRAWIAYVERNKFLINKTELIELLKEVRSDTELSDRILMLIFK